MTLPVNDWKRIGIAVTGALLPIAIWVGIKYGLHVPDRYLPSPFAVAGAYRDLSPPILEHAAASIGRLVGGGIIGASFGIAIAILMYSVPTLGRLLTPLVQSLRSVPAVATVPFFIVWFGFTEIGRLLLIFLGVGLNVLVAAHQILTEMPEKYQIALTSFGHATNAFPLAASLPIILERILPTMRTSLSIAFAVAIVAESLGAQVGLGHLIETSNSNYSMHTMFLAALVLGLANVGLDSALIILWRRIVYWRRDYRLRNLA